jgi:hypothetical protein
LGSSPKGDNNVGQDDYAQHRIEIIKQAGRLARRAYGGPSLTRVYARIGTPDRAEKAPLAPARPDFRGHPHGHPPRFYDLGERALARELTWPSRLILYGVAALVHVRTSEGLVEVVVPLTVK